jgi:hypothetical protein
MPKRPKLAYSLPFSLSLHIPLKTTRLVIFVHLFAGVNAVTSELTHSELLSALKISHTDAQDEENGQFCPFYAMDSA